jgi:chemotaxis protein MotB
MSSKWNRALTLVALLAVVVAAPGCLVSKNKYVSATQTADSLAARSQQLQKSLDETQKSLDAANAKSASLATQVAAGDSAVQQLSGEIEAQKKANSEAQAAYESMLGKLQEEVSSGHVQVQRMRDGIQVNLAQDILFKSGSATLDTTGKALLKKVAEELKGSTYEVVVIGHTDNQKIGPSLAKTFPNNWILGGARAVTIVRLFEDAGVAPQRLLVESAGENRPRADNSTAEGREKNRRIEVRLRPVEVQTATTP